MALLDDLISHWRLNEASGTRTDVHGSSDLTDRNTVTSEAGVIDDAASFATANNEALEGPTGSPFQFGQHDNFHIVCWVRLDDKAKEMAIIGRWGAGGSNERCYLLEYNQAVDRFRFLWSSTGSSFVSKDADTLGSPSATTWYMIDIYHDADNDEIGIGVNAGTHDTGPVTGAGTHDAAGVGFFLGSLDDPAITTIDLNGDMDSTSVWGRKLTDAERTSLYNSGSGLDYPFGESLAAAAEDAEVKTLLDAAQGALSAQFVPIHNHLQINRPEGDSGVHAYTILYREEDA